MVEHLCPNEASSYSSLFAELISEEMKQELIERMAIVDQRISDQQAAIADIRRLEDHRLEFAESTLLNQLERAKELQAKNNTVASQIEPIVEGLLDLDRSKRNLQGVMTLIEKIQMIQMGIGKLEALAAAERYKETAPLLLGIMQLAESLEPLLLHTKSLGNCLVRLEESQEAIWNGIFALFKSFAGIKGGFRPNRIDAVMLAQAVLVVEVLGQSFRKKLIDWYVESQLKDYKELFRGTHEMASLGKLNNRFHWLQRLLARFKEEHEIIFMPSWNLAQILCAHFCATTSKDIVDMLRQQQGHIDPEVLLTSIRETQGFERGLAQMFPEVDGKLFLVSIAFEGHMGLFIQLQDRELGNFLASLPAKLESFEFDSGCLVASAPRFFLLIRDALQDISALGSPSLVRELFAIFNKTMCEYSKYLQDKLPKRLAMGKSLKPLDIRLVCALLSTTAYCIETSEQLNKQILQSPCLGSSPVTGLEAAIQSFHVLGSLCLSQLDMHTEYLLYDSWEEMAACLKDSWNTKHQVGDQSPYVARINSGFESVLMQARKYISRPETLKSIANRLVRMVLDRFRDTILACKPLSSTGAQQLLVDLTGLRRGLSTVEKTRRKSQPDESDEELRIELANLEGILKTVMLPIDPPRIFIEGFLLLVADPSHFKRVLELRSLTKTEQSDLLEEFSRMFPDAPSGPLMKDRLGQATRRTQISTTDQVINRIKYFDLDEQVLSKLPIPAVLRKERGASPS